MDQPRNPARARLAQGSLALGMGVRFARTAEIARMMCAAGYDWLFIDLEHGPGSLESTAQISSAALDAGIAPLVRVPHGQFDMATRALDAGGWGIVMPHVDTADEARALVAALKYPPLGHRSIVGGLPHYGYASVKASEAAKAINAELLIVAMVETPKAIANAEAIAAIPGIDVVLIGTNDLALEMGIPGELGHERIAEAYKSVVAACAKHRKWPGMGGVGDLELIRRYVGLGMRFVLAGNDTNILAQASAERAKALRALL
ncbi:MAG TPA: aldolase/citrate lyase family protein [Stellaceae bacterium]|nr:aldolase/citrate lyase family protein [Stellaceae bacterium]